jgi:hypothetical protein
MADRKIEISVDEQLARRLLARAVDLNTNLQAVTLTELKAWVGDWGTSYAVHVVTSGETLSKIARLYYGDLNKAAVIAAYNDIADPNILRVGQVLRIPNAKSTPVTPLRKGESPYLFGIHDRGGEYLMGWSGRKGWVLVTEALGADPNDWSGRNYADLSDQGYGVMARINHGYNPQGTLPASRYYGNFARRVGNMVERSSGCHIWMIGNEPNLAVERPGGPDHGEVITAEMYARCYRMCREEIRSRPGHADDQVVTAAIGPWNIQTKYADNPTGDWIVYFQQVLGLLGKDVDGIAIHTYSRDGNPANITSEARMGWGFEHRRSMFRSYIDYMQAIPPLLRTLPVYITETDQNIAWVNQPNSWIQEAYAEINRWNANPTQQKIRSLILYRWERVSGDIWYLQGKDHVIADLRAALQHEYRWYG